MYLDREEEFKIIEQFIEDDVKVIFIETVACSGFTSFIDARFTNYKKYHVKYHAERKMSLGEMIFQEMTPEDLVLMQEIADLKYGEYEKKLLSVMAEGIIPHLGGLLSNWNEGKKTRPVYDLNYNLFYSLIPELFVKISQKSKIGVFIDGAQYVSEMDYKLIKEIADIQNCYVIIGFVEPFQEYYKLKFRLENCKKKHTTFDITEDLVILFAENYRKENISKSDAKSIIEMCNHNIYKICDYFLDKNDDSDLDTTDKAVLNICYIMFGGININRLTQIVMSDANNICDEELCIASVAKLKQLGYLNEEYDSIYLNNASKFICSQENNIHKLYYKKIVYDFFSSVETLMIQEIELCYILSKELLYSSQSSEWAKRLTVEKLRLGLPIDGDLLTELEKQGNSELLIILYTYQKDYVKALDIIEKLKKERGLSKDFKKIYGVILNRCRFHLKAQKRLIKSLKKDPQDFILKAYLVSNYVHQDNLEEAKKVYQKGEDFLKNTKANTEAAYFYRNSGAIYWHDLTPLENAVEIFKNCDDLFGLYSSECNLLTRKMMLNPSNVYLDSFRELESNLSVYGYDNMYILYNNMGLAALYADDCSFATMCFQLADTFSSTLMSRLFATINSACMHLKQGKTLEAKRIIDSIESEVNEFGVNRVAQKYYINKAMIYFANNLLDEKILQCCLNNPDRYMPLYTTERVSYYREKLIQGKQYNANDWINCFCPCYLEYWYINPLKLFSEESINQILSI